MEISKQVIDRVLQPYLANARVLKSAGIDFPMIHGRFLIGPTFYYSPKIEHATDIEIQLCLNQLVYAGVAEIIGQKTIPELDGINFYELQKEGMLIIESRKRFRRQIKTNKEISGEIKLGNWKKVRSLFLSNADFKFENRSCFGELELALILPKV